MDKKFIENLENASKIVSQWPQWKKDACKGLFQNQYEWIDGEFIPSSRCNVL